MSIDVKGLYKHFGNFTALNNVSIHFPAGGLVALLGPSGCGKTSLLRTIAGLEKPDAGEVFFDDQNALDQSIQQRQVGFVFQHYALFKHMSVFENVAFGLRAQPKKYRLSNQIIKHRVTELLRLVQLEWLAERYPAQLSGGQRQRVALARALAIEPKVLLLDEPFGALDAKVRKELRRWLRQLHDELHITSIFVTHDQEEALEVADTIVVMNKGKIEQIGTPEDVYNNPANEFVFRFLGSSNRLEGEVENGILQVGQSQIPVKGLADSANAIIYSRPQDIRVSKACERQAACDATIGRALSIGPTTRLEVLLAASQTYVEVELSTMDFKAMPLQVGDKVTLEPQKIKMFN